MRVEAVAQGTATVTVTATDPEGLSAESSFEVTVPNRAPLAGDPIPDMEVFVGDAGSFDASGHFTDPDGDNLTYTAMSSNRSVVRVSVSESTVTATARSKGTVTVTIRATDPEGLSATQTFQATVPNRAPVAEDPIPNMKMLVGDEESFEASVHFSDPDGDALTYSASSSNRSVARVSVSRSTVVVEGESQGSATVTVTARDPGELSARLRFAVEVTTLPNRPPRAVGTIPDQDIFEDDTLSLDVEDYFTDPDGDELTYTIRSWRPSVATATMSGSTATIVGVSEGSTPMTVTATDPGDLFAIQTFDVNVSVRESFDLEMRFTSSVSRTVRSHVGDARDEWEAVLKDTELDDIEFKGTVTCRVGRYSIRGYVDTVDDHLIFVHVDEIDGEGGILAYARYCYERRSDKSPVVSGAVFDEADIGVMLDEDGLTPVAFHEMAHGLGFPGLWDYHELLDTLDADDPHFEGELAIEAFDDAGGEDYDGEKVPVQLKIHGHWRESVFGDEIMTSSIDLENDEDPISAITLQAFADVGYEVDVSRADDYELPSSDDIQARRRTGRIFDLSNDVVWGPVIVVDADGRVIRVIPPPPGAVRWPLPGREVRIEPPGRAPQPGRTQPGAGSRSR